MIINVNIMQDTVFRPTDPLLLQNWTLYCYHSSCSQKYQTS